MKKARAEIVNTMEGIEVIIPEKKDSGSIVFLLIWLVGWSIGEHFVLMSLFTGGTQGQRWGATVFLLTWLTGWTVGGITAIFALSKALFGRETIVITRLGVEIRQRDFFLAKKRFYDAAHIADFRLAPEAIARGGCILFDYGLETIRVAVNLDYAEAKSIFDQIAATQVMRKSKPRNAMYSSFAADSKY